MKIVYYTSGIPGTGRIVQAISFYNAFKRKHIECEFTIVSSTELARLADRFNIKHIEIPLEDETSLLPRNYAESQLYKTLTALAPDVLIVDRMWFTLYHFIEFLPCKKVFFTIQVRDEFFKINGLTGSLVFNPGQYDRVLAIEPFKSYINLKYINPVMIRNRDEILPKAEAAALLGLDSNERVCAVALNYKEGYFEKLVKKYSYLESAGYHMIYTTNLKGGGLFPLVDYFNAMDFIVTAAGYTQFWETRYFNKEAAFEVFPLNFSNMRRRLAECSDYTFDENGANQFVDIVMKL